MAKNENDEKWLKPALDSVTEILKKRRKLMNIVKDHCEDVFHDTKGFINSNLYESFEKERKECEQMIEDLKRSIADGRANDSVMEQIGTFLWRYNGEKDIAELKTAFLDPRLTAGGDRERFEPISCEKNDDFLANHLLINFVRLCQSSLRKMDSESYDQPNPNRNEKRQDEPEKSITLHVVLKLKKKNIVYLGIHLSRLLIDILVLLTDKQLKKLAPLRHWIVKTAKERNSKVHVKLKDIWDRTTRTLEEIEERKIVKVSSKIGYQHIHSIKSAITKSIKRLQSVVKGVSEECGGVLVKEEIKLAKLEVLIKEFEEKFEGAKETIEKMKKESGRGVIEFSESFGRRMEEEIVQIWSSLW